MEKTSFITPWGTFCYRVMPFGLKNAGATYQRAMTTLFHDMIHKEIEIYVDDMIARTEEEHVTYLLSYSGLWDNTNSAWILTNVPSVFVQENSWVSLSAKRELRLTQTKLKQFEKCLLRKLKSKWENFWDVWITFRDSYISWLQLAHLFSSFSERIKIASGQMSVKKLLKR